MKPWHDRREKQDLRTGEFTITWWAHACATIRCGDFTIATDPWLMGTAFLGGWQLWPEAPPEALEAVARADLIWISHGHPDHDHPETLAAVVNRFPWLTPAGQATLREHDDVGEWCNISADLRIMRVPDAASKWDSALLVEYKGWRILNQVDCREPCGMDLPEVDVVLGRFSGGAGGYPACWPNHGTETTRLLEAEIERAKTVAKSTKCTYWMPFAGYFRPVRDTVWMPHTFLDESFGRKEHPQWKANHAPTTAWEIDRSTQAIGQSPLQGVPFDVDGGYHRAVREYVVASRYEGTLRTLEIAEADHNDELVCLHRFEFGEGDVPEPSLRIEVPSTVLRRVLRERLPWSDMAIGFHASMRRAPRDDEQRDFWNHFDEVTW